MRSLSACSAEHAGGLTPAQRTPLPEALPACCSPPPLPSHTVQCAVPCVCCLPSYSNVIKGKGCGWSVVHVQVQAPIVCTQGIVPYGVQWVPSACRVPPQWGSAAVGCQRPSLLASGCWRPATGARDGCWCPGAWVVWGQCIPWDAGAILYGGLGSTSGSCSLTRLWPFSQGIPASLCRK